MCPGRWPSAGVVVGLAGTGESGVGAHLSNSETSHGAISSRPCVRCPPLARERAWNIPKRCPPEPLLQKLHRLCPKWRPLKSGELTF